MTIREILRDKDRKIISIDGNATVSQAVAEMVAANVGSVIILIEGVVEGIFTERDALGLWNDRVKAGDAHVMNHMSSKLVITGPDDTVEQALAVMSEKNIRHLLVVEGKKMSNILSVKDLIKTYVVSIKADVQYIDKLLL